LVFVAIKNEYSQEIDTKDGSILTLYFFYSKQGEKVDILNINPYVNFKINYYGIKQGDRNGS